MTEFSTSQTKANLMKAFAGESMARNRYNMAASCATSEGYHALARLFDFTAKQEQAHATVFYNFLKEVNDTNFDISASYPVNVYTSTRDHLNAAVKNEYEEHNSIYRSFAETAKQEGFNQIANAFGQISEIEKIHAERFELFLRLITDSKLAKDDSEILFVCTNCGHIHKGTSAPLACPVCSHPQGYFVKDSIKEKTTILL